MTFITVSQGGPKPEDDIPDGVYSVQLTDIKDPRTVTARRGPKAGQEMDLIDWIFFVDKPGTPLHDRQLDGSTSTASGPRSKMFAWLTALLGGKPPLPQTQFAKTDLIGRYALATVAHDDGGWPQIDSLGAMPAEMLAQRVAAATGAPTNQPVAATQPIRQPEPDAAFVAAGSIPEPATTAAPETGLPF